VADETTAETAAGGQRDPPVLPPTYKLDDDGHGGCEVLGAVSGALEKFRGLSPCDAEHAQTTAVPARD